MRTKLYNTEDDTSNDYVDDDSGNKKQSMQVMATVSSEDDSDMDADSQSILPVNQEVWKKQQQQRR